MRNGKPAQAMIFNTATNTVEKEIPIATTVTQTHGQFRHIRMTPHNTILVPHMGENKVVEYDLDGKQLFSVAVPSPWSAIELKNGNIMISSNKNLVREVNRKGETVWEFNQTDAPEYKLINTQTAYRLANGNTVISNWCAGNNKSAEWLDTVQFIEVTPDKKVVWALRSWADPVDLGPSTSIQFLDEPGAPDSFDQKRFEPPLTPHPPPPVLSRLQRAGALGFAAAGPPPPSLGDLLRVGLRQAFFRCLRVGAAHFALQFNQRPAALTIASCSGGHCRQMLAGIGFPWRMRIIPGRGNFADRGHAS